MEVSLELERTIAGNSKKPMMPQRRVFRVGSRIWRVVGLKVVNKVKLGVLFIPTDYQPSPMGGLLRAAYYEHQVACHTGGRVILGGGDNGRTGKLEKIILEMIK
ncbi:hypothetical protein BK708_28520 [Bacillus thuringiensis serovar yunnanensis]|nr:hypothetical protein BK708_28520 [Bacillus thuringiensis serovar yunnanensis]